MYTTNKLIFIIQFCQRLFALYLAFSHQLRVYILLSIHYFLLVIISFLCLLLYFLMYLITYFHFQYYTFYYLVPICKLHRILICNLSEFYYLPLFAQKMCIVKWIYSLCWLISHKLGSTYKFVIFGHFRAAIFKQLYSFCWLTIWLSEPEAITWFILVGLP